MTEENEWGSHVEMLHNWQTRYSYVGQYERVKRWYSRIKKIHEGQTDQGSFSYLEDDFYAFFQNCFHLRDWIEKDGKILKKIPVKEYLKNNQALTLCADIANASKHLELDKKKNKEVSSTLRFSQKQYSLDTFSGIVSAKFRVELNEKTTKDAFELATECIEALDFYLKNCVEPIGTGDSL